jgi:IclR family transcriptional regulator, pca regulon regulatory protein
VAVLDDKEIVYVAGMPAKRSLSLTLTIGSRLPAYPTSMGRVPLAAFPRARSTSTWRPPRWKSS